MKYELKLGLLILVLSVFSGFEATPQDSLICLNAHESYVVQLEFKNLVEKGKIRALKAITDSKTSKFSLYAVELCEVVYQLDSSVYLSENDLKNVHHVLINKEDLDWVKKGNGYFTATNTFDMRYLCVIRRFNGQPTKGFVRNYYGYFSGLMKVKRMEKWIGRIEKYLFKM